MLISDFTTVWFCSQNLQFDDIDYNDIKMIIVENFIPANAELKDRDKLVKCT